MLPVGTGLEPGEEGAPAEGEGRPAQPSRLPSQGFFPWKNSEGHQRDQTALGGFPGGSQECPGGVPAPCGSGRSSGSSGEEGKGWEGTYWRMAGSWLLPRGRFHVRDALPLRAPEAEGRTRGMPGSTSHPATTSPRPPTPTTGSASVDSHSHHGFRGRGFPARLLCRSLSPFPKLGAEQWAKAEGYLLTDNLPT